MMHTLHTRTAQIFHWWSGEQEANSEEGRPFMPSLWSTAWCPLLQGIARLCCDYRRQVRMCAITYLQRGLLFHDLQTLTAQEWESCFNQVLFPLLTKLLEPVPHQIPGGLEEIQMRAATVLSKVFLHHLSPLLSLPTFTALWLTILDFMDKYMHADKSDLLFEAIPESLKNMLLVMDSAKVFSTADGYSPLWTITWDRINSFLPSLKEELFKSHPSVEHQGKPSETTDNEPVFQSPVSTAFNDFYPGSYKDFPVQATVTSPTSTPALPKNVENAEGQLLSQVFSPSGQMESTSIGNLPKMMKTNPEEGTLSLTATLPITYSYTVSRQSDFNSFTTASMLNPKVPSLSPSSPLSYVFSNTAANLLEANIPQKNSHASPDNSASPLANLGLVKSSKQLHLPQIVPVSVLPGSCWTSTITQ
ncbi:hypothetical protein J437_LFUL005497, partial [Ladona fulva]